MSDGEGTGLLWGRGDAPTVTMAEPDSLSVPKPVASCLSLGRGACGTRNICRAVRAQERVVPHHVG